MPFKKLCCGQNFIKRIVTTWFFTEFITVIVTIKTQAYQKIVFTKKPCPLFIYKCSVCLNAIKNSTVFNVFFIYLR